MEIIMENMIMCFIVGRTKKSSKNPTVIEQSRVFTTFEYFSTILSRGIEYFAQILIGFSCTLNMNETNGRVMLRDGTRKYWLNVEFIN